MAVDVDVIGGSWERQKDEEKARQSEKERQEKRKQ